MTRTTPLVILLGLCLGASSLAACGDDDSGGEGGCTLSIGADFVCS